MTPQKRVRQPRPLNFLWTDEELSSAVEAYVFLLRLERSGLIPNTSASEALLIGALNGRNEASVRYRMRNISAVIRELNGPTLEAYSPAEQVGTRVRARLKTILNAHPGFQEMLRIEKRGGAEPGFLQHVNREEALQRLATLRQQMTDLERELIGVGHNRPPEPLSCESLLREDFARAHEDVRVLEAEIGKARPDRAVVTKQSGNLLNFGMKVALWLGARATKFADVSLAMVAPVAVAKAMDLLPVLQSAVTSVLRFVMH